MDDDFDPLADDPLAADSLAVFPFSPSKPAPKDLLSKLGGSELGEDFSKRVSPSSAKSTSNVPFERVSFKDAEQTAVSRLAEIFPQVTLPFYIFPN